MDIYSMHLQQIKEEAPDIKTFFFDIPDGIDWEEGAHLHLAYPDFLAGDRPNRRKVRHMSIASLPSEEHIAITTKIYSESPFKHDLKSLAIGDEMQLFKMGSRLTLRRLNRPLVLLSMGVGLAAFRPLILAMHQDASNISSLTSLTVARPGMEVYRDELLQYKSDKISQEYIHSQDEYYARLEAYADDCIYYLVGSDLFVRQNLKFLFDKGIQKEQIILDMRDDLRDYYFDTSR